MRELENAIERAVVIAPGDEITRECLRREIADPQAAAAVAREGVGASSGIDVGRGINFYDEVRRFEIDLIRRALDQTGGHQSRAARLLGMNRHHAQLKDQDLQHQPASVILAHYSRLTSCLVREYKQAACHSLHNSQECQVLHQP